MTNNENEAGMPTGIVEYINNRAQNIVRYSDKLSEALTVIDKYFETVGPKAGIRFNDTTAFYQEYNDQIGKIAWTLSVRQEWGLYAIADCEYVNSKLVMESSRAMKKAAIDRLPEFIQRYACTLQAYKNEYKEVSEKAEKIADILKM
jgi:hypothetical protein